MIYTGTRVNTDIYARWLDYIGIKCTGYHAGFDADTRKEIEKGLMMNKWKCIISTNALGMGIDKPDIRFVIHTQIPASPIHYYQEIGRAGRDGLPTVAILFYNAKLNSNNIQEDCKLPLAFIENSRPSSEDYQKVIEALKKDPLGERNLMKLTNLKQTQIRTIKADLIDQNIIKEVIYYNSKRYEYQYGATLLDTKKFEDLKKAKLKDMDAMVDYIFTSKPRMQFLCSYLGDEQRRDYHNCDNTNLKKMSVDVTTEDEKRICEFRENYFPRLDVENKKYCLLNGVAASYYGVSNVGNVIHRCKYESGGDFPDFLVSLALKAYRKTFSKKNFDVILYVPPTVSGNLVRNFAIKIGKALNIDVSETLIKTRETKEQKVFHNGYSKRDNIANAFAINNQCIVNRKSVLLIDDIFDSGATIKEIGCLLFNTGVKEVAPLVIARTVGSDL